MNPIASRFLQRLDSYGKAFAKLEELVELFNENSRFVIFNPAESGLDKELAREDLRIKARRIREEEGI